MKRRFLLLLLLASMGLTSCGGKKTSGKKNCDAEGVCRIGDVLVIRN